MSAPEQLPAKLKEVAPDLAIAHPNVAAAFERHQPYHSEKAYLAYLRPLARVNKHRDFTLQEGTPFAWTEVKTPWGTIGMQGQAAGTSVDLHNGDETFTYTFPEAETYMDWFFVDPAVRVIDTLDQLSIVVPMAVRDVRATALGT